MNKKILLSSITVSIALSATSQVQAEDSVFVGHLADMSGPTAFVGKNPMLMVFVIHLLISMLMVVLSGTKLRV